jgi:hypothetical protein
MNQEAGAGTHRRFDRDFYARTPEDQEGIICKMPLCCRRRLSNLVEYQDEDHFIYVEGKCLQCGKRYTIKLEDIRWGKGWV